jgi:hypothetical protein
MRLVPLEFFILANVTFTVEYFNSPVQMEEDDKIVNFILKAKMHYGISFHTNLISHFHSHIFHSELPISSVLYSKHSVVKKANQLVIDAVRHDKISTSILFVLNSVLFLVQSTL